MDPRRARIGEWLTGGFGALLLGSLFISWYRACQTQTGGGGCRDAGASASAWSAFSALDVFLALTGALALAALVLTLVQRTPALPLALTSLGVPLALVAAVLAAARLLAPPDLAGVGADDSVARLLGAWLGAGFALGLLAAMLAAIRDERVDERAAGSAGAPERVRTLSLSSGGAPGSAPSPSEPEAAA